MSDMHDVTAVSETERATGQPNRKTTIFLAALLGVFGIHWYYVGRRERTKWHVLFSWTLLPALVGLWEATRFARMDDESFRDLVAYYNDENLPWSETYWRRLKNSFLVVFGLSVIAVYAAGITVPANATFSTSSSPVAYVTVLVFALSLFVFPFVLCYYLVRDQRELAAHVENVNPFPSLVVVVLFFVSGGLYLVWYAFRRRSKARRASISTVGNEPGDEPERPSGDATRSEVESASNDPERVADSDQTSDGRSSRRTTELETLRSEGDSRLEEAKSKIEAGEYETATLLLDDARSQYRDGRTQAVEVADFDASVFESRLEDVQQERQRLDRLTDQQRRNDKRPAQIPRHRELDLEYDAIAEGAPIGSGGNADVTEATVQTDAGEVTLAVKKPRLSGTLHSETVERMLQEAETWDKLDDHDHVVGIVDYGAEPLPWIAMEYMDANHLGERGPEMDVEQALWTAIATTKAVRHAHRRGVAHLDLKPENILFRTTDEETWDVPKVADWGLSKHLLEHSKSVEGMSPHYSAPEQFDEDIGPVDDVTDVYQLGAVFYELFTGRPPFDGRPTQVMRAVMDDDPVPPSEVADIPEKLDDVLLRALEKEKADRYESVLYLRDDLQQLFSAQM